MRGAAWLAKGDPDKAMLDVNAAMEADPEDINTLVLRGQVREALRLQADAGNDQLRALPGVLQVDAVEDDLHEDLWDLTIEEGAEAQQILQTCFAQGITLRSFDHNEPTLHDVFVELVGEDAREAQKR